jgi:hypothetical protein
MNLLYLTVPAALAAALALAFAIPALVRRARLDTLATLVVAAEQRVELPAGEVVLHLAGPFGAVGLGSLSFDLIAADGTALPTSPVLVRSRRSSREWGVLLARQRFSVPSAGTYRLQVGGIQAAGRDLSRCRLLLARPQDAGLVLGILAVVFSAIAFIACSVLSLLFWFLPAAMAA